MGEPVPAISVCVNVYNAQRYVGEAVQSILDQTFGDFEVIAVDDGSTDHSLRILQNLAKRDSRLRVLSQPNGGPSVAANTALAVARGQFIARMDADDISMPQRFEKQIAFLREHPAVVLLGSRVLLIDPYGCALYKSDHPLEHDAIDKLMLSGVGWSVVQPVAMIRASALKQVGGYRADRTMSEDLDMHLRLAEVGKVANLPDILLKYRQHAKSLNHTRVHVQNRLKGEILREAFIRRGIPLPDKWVSPQRHVMPIPKEIRMWGWLALKNGNVSAARKHSMSVLRIAPFSLDSWRLMACAIRGY